MSIKDLWQTATAYLVIVNFYATNPDYYRTTFLGLLARTCLTWGIPALALLSQVLFDYNLRGIIEREFSSHDVKSPSITAKWCEKESSNNIPTLSGGNNNTKSRFVVWRESPRQKCDSVNETQIPKQIINTLVKTIMAGSNLFPGRRVVNTGRRIERLQGLIEEVQGLYSSISDGVLLQMSPSIRNIPDFGITGQCTGATNLDCHFSTGTAAYYAQNSLVDIMKSIYV